MFEVVPLLRVQKSSVIVIEATEGGIPRSSPF